MRDSHGQSKPVRYEQGSTQPKLDPITLEVVRNKLDGIANEMQSTLLRSSFSTVVKEGLDASASLFTADGETLSQAIAIPIHLATLIPIVLTMIEKFPRETMREGDIYIMNDPYLGGTHLPDIAIVMPVFHQDQLVAFSAAMTHHQDVGGMSPGSVPPNATEIYQEGIRIPPLKLREAGVYNETLLDMLKLNVRISEMFMGDLGAQIAACTVGAQRLGELAKRHGNDYLQFLFETLLTRSEQMTRAALAAIPDGTYSYIDYLDNDGIDLDTPVRIEVAVTIRDDSLHFRHQQTTRGPFNAVPSGISACLLRRACVDRLSDSTGTTCQGNAGQSPRACSRELSNINGISRCRRLSATNGSNVRAFCLPPGLR